MCLVVAGNARVEDRENGIFLDVPTSTSNTALGNSYLG